MKKLFYIFIISICLIYVSCAGITGPRRDISIENRTSVTQSFNLLINDSQILNVSIPASDTYYTTIIGGFKIQDLNFRYKYVFSQQHSIYITAADQKAKTVINNLTVDVELLDNNVSEFTASIPANSFTTVNVYNTNHVYTLRGSQTAGNIPYVEVNNTKYYYEIKYVSDTIIISPV